MYLVSAIIPVYGVNRNLENLVRIIETCPNVIQVVIVHDNSDGESFQALNRFLPYSNVEIATTTGNSPGATRNHGLQFVKAGWVTFWDADDLPNPQAIVQQVEAINDAEIQLIVGSYEVLGERFRKRRIFSSNPKRAQNNLGLVANEVGLWRCLFNYKAIQQKSFLDLHIGEDQVYFLDCLPNDLSQIQFTELVFYHYRKDIPGSVMNSRLLESDFSQAIAALNHNHYASTIKRQINSRLLLNLKLSRASRYPTLINLGAVLFLSMKNPLNLFRRLVVK